MISFSSKRMSYISKIILTILFIYSTGYITYRAAQYYKIYFEKEKLTTQLQMKRNQTNTLKRQIELSSTKIDELEKEYIKKEELEVKIKDIFTRMSIFDYNLKYIDSKQTCLNRYVIVTQVSSQSENGLKAAEGILSFLGEIKKSEHNETIYYVDYISKAKEIK